MDRCLLDVTLANDSGNARLTSLPSCKSNSGTPEKLLLDDTPSNELAVGPPNGPVSYILELRIVFAAFLILQVSSFNNWLVLLDDVPSNAFCDAGLFPRFFS